MFILTKVLVRVYNQNNYIPWLLLQRYSQFYSLRRELRRRYDNKHHFRGFPKKRFFFNFSESVLEERKGKFELYINSLVELAPFLEVVKTSLAVFLQIDEVYTTHYSPTLITLNAFLRRKYSISLLWLVAVHSSLKTTCPWLLTASCSTGAPEWGTRQCDCHPPCPASFHSQSA